MAAKLQVDGAAESTGQIQKICMCDDVNGDMTAIVSYVVVYEQTPRAGGITSALLGTFTDDTLTAPYNPINPVPCDQIGAPAKCKQGRLLIEANDAWSPTSLIQSYSVTVLTLGDNPPTFTDSFGNTTEMTENEVANFQHNQEFIDTNVSWLSNAGSLLIQWTELGV